MRQLKAVSMVYMEAEIMAASTARFGQTAYARPAAKDWILVNNHWPLDKAPFTVEDQAHFMGATVADPGKNLGGHGGFTYGIKKMVVDDEDLVLNYDLDSWPVTPGWLIAMMDVMDADPTLAFVALLHNDVAVKYNPAAWKIEEIDHHQVGFLPHTEMWNVTLFRGKVIRDGMEGQRPFYGYVEHAMTEKLKGLGLRMGYMMNCREDHHPIPHPAVYTQYKADHASQTPYLGSFEQYLSEGHHAP